MSRFISNYCLKNDVTIDAAKVESLMLLDKIGNKDKVFRLYSSFLLKKARMAKRRFYEIELDELFNCYYIAFDLLYDYFKADRGSTFFSIVYTYIDKKARIIIADTLFDLAVPKCHKMFLISGKEPKNEAQKKLRGMSLNASSLDVLTEETDLVLGKYDVVYPEKKYEDLNEYLDIVIKELNVNSRSKRILSDLFRIDDYGDYEFLDIQHKYGISRALCSSYYCLYKDKIAERINKRMRRNYEKV